MLVSGAQYSVQYFLHYRVITMINLVTICNRTKILHYYWLYSLCYTFYPSIYFVLESLYLLIFLTFSLPTTSTHLRCLSPCNRRVERLYPYSSGQILNAAFDRKICLDLVLKMLYLCANDLWLKVACLPSILPRHDSFSSALSTSVFRDSIS